MVETTTTAITQALGVLAGAFGYHVAKNPIKKVVKKHKAKKHPKKVKRTKTYTMYDSVDPNGLPVGAEAYASYVDYNGVDEFENLVKRFGVGDHHYFSIALALDQNAACLDIENGAATLTDVLSWYERQKSRGQWRPCFYGQQTTLEAVVGELDRAGIPRADYRLWIAAWPGTGANVPDGYDGHQYATNNAYDTSVLRPDFFP